MTPHPILPTLFPCPFCAGDAERVDIKGGPFSPVRGGSCITCQSCGASSPVALTPEAKENLTSDWNRRPIAQAMYRAGLEAAARQLEAWALEALKDGEHTEATHMNMEADAIRVLEPPPLVARSAARAKLTEAATYAAHVAILDVGQMQHNPTPADYSFAAVAAIRIALLEPPEPPDDTEEAEL